MFTDYANLQEKRKRKGKRKRKMKKDKRLKGGKKNPTRKERLKWEQIDY